MACASRSECHKSRRELVRLVQRETILTLTITIKTRRFIFVRVVHALRFSRAPANEWIGWAPGPPSLAGRTVGDAADISRIPTTDVLQ